MEAFLLGSHRREGRPGGLKQVTFELSLWGEVELQQIRQRGRGLGAEKPGGVAQHLAGSS